MNLLDSIMDQLDDGLLQQLGKSAGVNSSQAKSAAGAAVPFIVSALQRNASSSRGADSLDRALSKDHDGSILGQLGDLFGGGGSSAGGKILGHVLGSRQQQAERGVSQMAGIDAGSAAKLMSMLAPMVMGALGKAKRDNGFSASDLTQMLNREEQEIQRRDPKTGGLMGALLDSDGDGDVDFSDIASRGAGLLGSLFKR